MALPKLYRFFTVFLFLPGQVREPGAKPLAAKGRKGRQNDRVRI
jgi:hypothetical protein